MEVIDKHSDSKNLTVSNSMHRSYLNGVSYKLMFLTPNDLKYPKNEDLNLEYSTLLIAYFEINPNKIDSHQESDFLIRENLTIKYPVRIEVC